LTDPQIIEHHRQAAYWRLLSALFGHGEQAPNFEQMAAQIAGDLDLPEALLDPHMAVDTLLQRYPELASAFVLDIADGEPETATLQRALVVSKLLLNVFGPNTQAPTIGATEYAQWLKDVEHLERAFGFQPGGLRGQGRAGAGTNTSGGQGAGTGPCQGFDIGAGELQQALAGLENDLIKRMALRELLQDDRLASQLTPSIGLVEQLLRDKANLSGNALKHAKRLIREYIDEMAEVLRLQVAQTPSGKIDRSVPPKRVFRNLDLDRTIWKNLINWNPEEQRLYVDRLYFKQTARKKLPTRLIVVVDQSGSMVNAMVQCTILASIFAGLPNVEVYLLAFDTRVLDLTDWVADPFEVVMRTQLGGGTHIHFALEQAAEKIQDPRRTALVLITDFYEGGSNQVLLDYIKSLRESGVHFIPVGSVSSSGYFSVNEWFRTRLKDLGMPVLTGSPKKLIVELKKLIVT
jgi:Mg-chelatase subunit ChlD